MHTTPNAQDLARQAIADLREAAAEAGDLDQVHICDAALLIGPESSCWQICQMVIARTLAAAQA